MRFLKERSNKRGTAKEAQEISNKPFCREDDDDDSSSRRRRKDRLGVAAVQWALPHLSSCTSLDLLWRPG